MQQNLGITHQELLEGAVAIGIGFALAIGTGLLFIK